MSSYLSLSIEIELPDDVSDEYQDTMVEDISYEPHLDRLRNIINRWVRLITGERCHVEITVD